MYPNSELARTDILTLPQSADTFITFQDGFFSANGVLSQLCGGEKAWGLFKTRLDKHKADVNSNSNTQFTRSQRKASQSTIHKSTVTDHFTHENHEIDWEKAKIMNKESNKRRRHVHEAKWIKHHGGHWLGQGELHVFSPPRSRDKMPFTLKKRSCKVMKVFTIFWWILG